MGLHLVIHPAFRDLLAANGLREYGDFMRAPADGAALSPHWNRETVRLMLTDDAGQRRVFYLKRMFRPQPEHVIADLLALRWPRAQPWREFKNIQSLSAARISGMTVAAVGEQRSGPWPRSGFLLGEALPAPYTVADWLGLPGAAASPQIEPWMARRLLVELGGLACRMQQAGLHWLDVDPKHIFARPVQASGPGQRWEFFLIDLERMHARQTPAADGISMAVAVADALHPSALVNGSRAPGPWDWLIYRGALRAGACRRSGNQHDSDRATERFMLALSRNRRAATNAETGSRMLAVGTSDPTGSRENGLWMNATGHDLLHRAGLANFEALYAFDSGEPLRKPGLGESRRRDRIELTDANGALRCAYLKRYDTPGAGFRWPWSEPPLSAASEARAAERLRRAAVPVPDTLAHGERTDERGCVRGVLLLAAADGDSLERICRDITSGHRAAPSPTARRRLILDLARIVRRMHDHGLFHRDLYLSHVFVADPEGRAKLTLIDLARVIRRRRRLGRWQIKDLAALAYSSPTAVVTLSDRIRFLGAYLGGKLGRRTGNKPAAWLPVSPAVRSRLGQRIGRIESGVRAREQAVQAIARIESRVRRMARHDRRKGRIAGSAAGAPVV